MQGIFQSSETHTQALHGPSLLKEDLIKTEAALNVSLIGKNLRARCRIMAWQKVRVLEFPFDIIVSHQRTALSCKRFFPREAGIATWDVLAQQGWLRQAGEPFQG